MLAITTPFPQFFDLNGDALSAGSIYVGVAGLDPIANPVAVTWDLAGTIPAPQPIKTINGAPARAGTPALIYVPDGAYSLLVKNKTGRQVFYAADASAYSNSAVLQAANSSLGTKVAAFGAPGGSDLVGYRPPGSGIVGTTKRQLDNVIYASNYATLQDAHDAVLVANPAGGILRINGTFALSTPLNWDYTKVEIAGCRGMGATIDCSGMTGVPYWVTLANQANSQAVKGMRDIRIVGPAASANVDGFPLFSSVSDAITNFVFEGLSIVDFRNQIVYGDQCSNVTFRKCFFGNTSANYRTSTVAITAATVVNSGERWSFDGCQFSNVYNILTCNAGVAGGWNFNQCALAYFQSAVVLNMPAVVNLDGCHVETSTYLNNWFACIGNGATIRAHQSKFWFAGTVTKEPFFSASNVAYGGFSFDDCDYHADTVSVSYWVDQSQLGAVSVRNWRAQDGQARIPFGKNPGVQREAWPTSSPNFGAGLVVDTGDASAVSISFTETFSGPTTSVGTSAIGQQIKRYKRFPVSGGQVLEGSVFVKASGFNADGTQFQITASVLDQNGLVIGTGVVLTSGDLANFTRVPMSWTPLTAPGAAFWEFRLYGNPSITAGPRAIYLADMTVNAY